MLHTIERDFTGYSEDEMNAAGFRALLCISFYNGLDWVRSFYDPISEQARCFYEAPSARELRHHAQTMAIPIGEVRPVVELRPVAPGKVQAGDPIDKADRRNSSKAAWVGRLDMSGLDVDAVAARFEAISDGPEGTWQRAYADGDISDVFAVFRTAHRKQADQLLRKLGLPIKDLREMTEILPADISGPNGDDASPIVHGRVAAVSR